MAKNDRTIEVTIRMTVRGTTERGSFNPKRILSDDDLETVARLGAAALATDWMMMKVMDGSDCLATCIKSEVVSTTLLADAG
jgi:hypothetical protein